MSIPSYKRRRERSLRSWPAGADQSAQRRAEPATGEPGLDVQARLEQLEGLALLAGGLAHDLNNLLTGIFGHVDLARAALPRGSAPAQRLDQVLMAVESARSLTAQLSALDVDRGEQKETCSLPDILRASTRFVLSGSSVSTVLSLPDDLWQCDIDRLQIRRVVDNLLINARQVSPPAGRVEIAARNVELSEPQGLAPGRYVEVTFTDQGPGIAPEHRQRIFEPFFTTKASGTGLGLATARSIVARHGGDLSFASETGRGTTFRLLLAASEPRPLRVAEGAGAGRREYTPTGERILVLDDDPSIRELLRLALGRFGYEVTVTAEGSEAVRVLEAACAEGRPYGLAMIDLTLVGDMSGVEALRRIKGVDANIRAVASSGYGRNDVFPDLGEAGFDGFLPKPYTIAELSAAVGGVFGARLVRPHR